VSQLFPQLERALVAAAGLVAAAKMLVADHPVAERVGPLGMQIQCSTLE